MKEVAKDIISINIKNNDTLESLYKKFYRIMRKHGIKEGTKRKDGVGILKNNYDWTMALTLFKDQISVHINMQLMMLYKTPKDLES